MHHIFFLFLHENYVVGTQKHLSASIVGNSNESIKMYVVGTH